MKNNFMPMIRVTQGVLLLCAVTMAALVKIYLIDNAFESSWWFLIYSIPVFIPALIFLVFLYNLKRNFAEGQEKLLKGEHLAKWSYGETQWSEFNRIEWKKSRRKAVGIPTAMLLLFLAFVLLDTGSSGEMLTTGTPFVVLFMGGLAASLYYYAYVLYRRTKDCPREVIIGRDGMLFGGYYNTWNAPGSWLAGVKYISGDMPVLEFNIKVMGKGGSNSRPLRVPVPPGKEIEAQRVAAQFPGAAPEEGK